MNRLNARVQSWLVWLLPFVVLALVIAWEADWGRKWRHVPATDTVVGAATVVIAVLPEYQPTPRWRRSTTSWTARCSPRRAGRRRSLRQRPRKSAFSLASSCSRAR